MAEKTTQTEQSLRYTPWEKKVASVLNPFEEFIHRQTTSGMLLMLTTVVALVLANSQWSEPYQHLLHMPIGFHIGGWMFSMSLHHWVNDGLMTLFFFVVGLELKRELLVGELSDFRQAALPVFAAMGGMLLPAILFLLMNANGPLSQGWGIPMATDIAFAVGILVLLAHRVPKSLIMFLVALAIADDLGAVLVIALFYTQQLALDGLIFAGLCVITLVFLNVSGFRNPIPYALLGLLLWIALLRSGIHATLAGVIVAFCVPARSRFDPAGFVAYLRKKLTSFGRASHQQANVLTNEALFSLTQEMEQAVKGVQTPLQRLESAWHFPVAYFVIPVFALTNAGIPIQLSQLGLLLTQPVTVGVMLGLVIGKFVGIAGASWLAIQFGLGQLPKGTRMSQIFAVAVLGGIGFTMSIFIAELAYAANPELIIQAKTGILFASFLSAVIGLVWLYVLGGRTPAKPLG